MARNFKELQAKMSPERLARSEVRVKAMLAAMPLEELREARALTQQGLANILGINQGAISKMEHRTDMYVSTLRTVIKAMGGELHIEARFPDGNVEVTQFREAKKTKA